VRLGIETQDRSLQRAQEENARIMNAVIAAIRRLNIPERNIQTASFTVFPLYQPRDRERPELGDVLTGYRVSNVVSVRIEDVGRVGAVVDAAMGAGANRVEGVSFGIRDEAPLRERALREATQEARRKAQTLAQAAGVRLVRIQTVSEGGVSVTAPPMSLERFAAAEAAPTPILPGEVQIRANVSISYVIE